MSISFQISSFKKCYRRCTVKQQKKTKKILTIKLNLSSNLVTEFHAGGARFEITTAALLFVVKNDIKTLFFSGNRQEQLQNQGAHYALIISFPGGRPPGHPQGLVLKALQKPANPRGCGATNLGKCPSP